MSRHPDWRTLGVVSLALTALTVAFTYPQVARLSTHVGPHYDALFSVWRLAWFAHQLPRDPLHLFDANIFHPATGTYAYSDALLVPNLLSAPLLWIGVDPVVAYNLVVLASFVAAGLGMFVWLTARRLPFGAVAIGTLAFAFQQYRFAHLPHLELLWTCWIPLAFWLLERLFAQPRARDGAWLGAVVAFQFLSSLYYGLFLVTSLAVLAAAFVVRRRRSAAQWLPLVRGGLLAVVVAATLVLPYAVPYLQTNALRGQRSGEAANWSAFPDNYLTTTAESLFFQRGPRWLTESEGVLFPGFLLVALAFAGLAMSSDWRRYAYAALAVVAFDISLGVNGVIFPVLSASVPGYGHLRVPARMFVIVSAALCVLASEGAAALMRRWSGRTPAVIALVLAAIVLAEAWSVPLPLQAVPERPPRLYRWLAEQPTGVVVEWPLPRASSLGATRTPEYMFYSIEHWQPLAVGYSGLYPEEYFSLIEELATFPSGASLEYLQRRRVRYLVLHSQPDRQRYDAARLVLADRPEVEFLFSDRTASEELALYRVHPKRMD